MSSELVKFVEFQENPEPRCHFVLLVDTSGSMGGSKINLVNSGLEMLKTDLCDDAKARHAVELTIVKFDSSVATVAAHVSPIDFVPPQLVASGVTRLAAAIQMGLDVIEQRRDEYRRAGVPYYAPWLWVITDGMPTDASELPAARDRLLRAARDGATQKTRIDVFMVGVQDDADPINFSVLRELSPHRDPLLLNNVHAFSGMFKWISQSLIAVSQSQPGAMVAMAPVAGWGAVGG